MQVGKRDVDDKADEDDPPESVTVRLFSGEGVIVKCTHFLLFLFAERSEKIDHQSVRHKTGGGHNAASCRVQKFLGGTTVAAGQRGLRRDSVCLPLVIRFVVNLRPSSVTSTSTTINTLTRFSPRNRS